MTNKPRTWQQAITHYTKYFLSQGHSMKQVKKHAILMAKIIVPKDQRPR